MLPKLRPYTKNFRSFNCLFLIIPNYSYYFGSTFEISQLGTENCIDNCIDKVAVKTIFFVWEVVSLKSGWRFFYEHLKLSGFDSYFYFKKNIDKNNIFFNDVTIATLITILPITNF